MKALISWLMIFQMKTITGKILRTMA